MNSTSRRRSSRSLLLLVAGAAAAALLLLLPSLPHAAAAAAAPADDDACLLALRIAPRSSQLVGSGDTSAPVPAAMTSIRMNATGTLFLNVPPGPGGACPPSRDAAALQAALERATLAVPVGDAPISFSPNDLRSNITTEPNNPKVEPIATFDFLGLAVGFEGTEPLGKGAVVVGDGSPKEARAAAQPLCAQLLLLGGTMNLSSLLGPRTADVNNVAYNRSLAAGMSLKKDGAAAKAATLVLRNASLFFNISPEGTPGVELSRAQYLLAGDVVAGADLGDAKAWRRVPAAKVDWGLVPRLDSPVVVGSDRPALGRIIGVNATAPQQCVPTRLVAASGAIEEAPPSAAGGGAGGGAAAAKSGARAAPRAPAAAAWAAAAAAAVAAGVAAVL